MTWHPGEVMWTPVEADVTESNIGRFAEMVGRTRGLDVTEYEAMWRWSVEDLQGFWSSVWEFFEIGPPLRDTPVLAECAMPGAAWFPETQVNLAERVLRPRGRDDAEAVVTVGEDGTRSSLTWNELRCQVGALAATLRGFGVAPGEVVVGYLPNVGEAIVAALATASLGAIWSGVGQDYAPEAAIDRFAQLTPIVLVTADGHRYAGQDRDRRGAVAALRAGLPTVAHVIGVPRLGHGVDDAVSFDEATAIGAPLVFAATVFGDPLWVLFSSGTTGLPKGIVHSHGGVTVEMAKLMGLHWDIRPQDRMTWYTSPSWVMWNALVGALGVGSTVVCFDGAPTPDGPFSLWKLVADENITVFGTSPGFLAVSQDRGIRPSDLYDLRRLRAMGSTGAPLPDRAFAYVRDYVGAIPLWSMSGGTDVAGAFALGAPNVPVWSGELSVRALGVALESWDDDGRPRVNEVGELIVTRPMPSMPIRFWNDPGGGRYRAAYFEYFPGVWRHGDWITVTARGSVVIHGRSDSTLNRHGVRMGSADIYAAVESMAEVAECLVIGAEEEDGGYWMPLFVVLAPGAVFDDGLVARMKQRIRDKASPRHVPDEVIAVCGIPHTRTGKKLEVPIKRLIQGVAYRDVVDPSIIDEPSRMESFVAIAADRVALVRSRAAADA